MGPGDFRTDRRPWDRRTVGPWAMGCWTIGSWTVGLGGKRAFFDLLPHSGKPVTARKALYGRKRRNGASLRLAKPSLSPELRPRSHSGARNQAQRGFQARGLRPHCRASCQNTARFCALGPHCNDSCHLLWGAINGQGSEWILQLDIFGMLFAFDLR